MSILLVPPCFALDLISVSLSYACIFFPLLFYFCPLWTSLSTSPLFPAKPVPLWGRLTMLPHTHLHSPLGTAGARGVPFLSSSSEAAL